MIDGHVGGIMLKLSLFVLTREQDSFSMTIANQILNLTFFVFLLFSFILSHHSSLLVFIPTFVPSSPSPPLFSLSSRGHGSFTGPFLSSSTTPRAETISLSSFCISHSKYNVQQRTLFYHPVFTSRNLQNPNTRKQL